MGQTCWPDSFCPINNITIQSCNAENTLLSDFGLNGIFLWERWRSVLIIEWKSCTVPLRFVYIISPIFFLYIVSPSWLLYSLYMSALYKQSSSSATVSGACHTANVGQELTSFKVYDSSKASFGILNCSSLIFFHRYLQAQSSWRIYCVFLFI